MSPHTILASPVWTAAGWTMLHLVWIGAIGGLVVALLRRLLRPARPEIRHGIAVACLVALAASPVLLFANLHRPGPAMSSAPEQVSRATSTHGSAAAPWDISPASDRSRPGPEPIAASSAPTRSRFEPLVDYLPGVWLSGSLCTLALIATGLVGVERLRRSSRPLEDGEIARRCRVLAARLGIVRRVGVAICDRMAMPVLIGVVRPMILLPPAALAGWGVEQIEMALLHELAHIRRHDNFVTLLQRLAESLLFFHPVTWWLSAWVSLERELCCDRLVVEHTGRPLDYARMLAALGGVTPGKPTMAMAMAERPLTTRIRRILDMEDRSMKLTMTEGLGLLAAAVVDTAFAMAAHAGPAQPGPQNEARRTLERLAQGIVAVPDGQEGYEGKGHALLEVAKAQNKLGDRAAALETLRLLDRMAETTRRKPGAKIDLRAWERFGALAQSAEVRREAGDLDGARATLDRAARYLDVLDDGAVRGTIERVAREIDAGITAKRAGSPAVAAGEEDELVGEAATVLIDQYIALGDMARARTLIRRLIAYVGPPQGPAKAAFIAALGGYLNKAGDPEGGRNLIERACQAARALPDPEARAFALPILAQSMFEAGQLDEALALFKELTPRAQPAVIRRILDQLATDDHSRAWFDPAGIAIKIGDPWLSPKDPAAARAALPKIAAAARASDDARVRVRTLAIIAHLQARAGDVPGALATARSIPDLNRSDFPGPSDGFYDAVKPVAFALIAGVQAEAGDRPSAVATLGEAEALARAVAAEDQKLVAQIAIAQKWTACGRPDAAKIVVAEGLPLALAQPEPRRSRVLAMFAASQSNAGDPAGALRTIDAIREYPGLEKARSLSMVARWYEEAGDTAASGAILRRAVTCLEAKAPQKPLPGKVMNLQAIGRDTFIDYDLELQPGLAKSLSQ